MKSWEKPNIIELNISDTEKNNGNHYGWNNPNNPHYVDNIKDESEVLS